MQSHEEFCQTFSSEFGKYFVTKILKTCIQAVQQNMAINTILQLTKIVNFLLQLFFHSQIKQHSNFFSDAGAMVTITFELFLL